jgi:hypothetical protein
MNNIWTYVGIALFIWVGWDLYAGYTLAWDVIYRDKDPMTYWVTVTIWAGLAISCFFSWGKDVEWEEFLEEGDNNDD